MKLENLYLEKYDELKVGKFYYYRTSVDEGANKVAIVKYKKRKNEPHNIRAEFYNVIDSTYKRHTSVGWANRYCIGEVPKGKENSKTPKNDAVVHYPEYFI